MDTKYIKAISASIFSVALYFVVYNAVSYLGRTQFDLPILLARGAGACICILLILYPFYLAPRPHGKRSNWEAAFWIFATALLGVVINILIFKIPYVRESEALLRQTNSFFEDGPLWQSLLLIGLLIPALEELVFRGVVFSQLRAGFGLVPSVILSALIFGGVHANIPQFMYASVMGIVLAIMYNRTKTILTSILAHGLTNISVALFVTYIGF